MRRTFTLDSKTFELLDRSAAAVATSKQRLLETAKLLQRSYELFVPPEQHTTQVVADSEKDLTAQQRAWVGSPELDKHVETARQSYGSRERQSAKAYSHGLRLFSPAKKASAKKQE